MDQPSATAGQLQTPFPNPPAFWKSFTPANLARWRELEASHADTAAAAAIPDDLRMLRPPTPPSGTFSVFGEERSLEARPPPIPQDERILPAPTDPGFPAAAAASVSASRIPAASPAALLSLTRSLLLAYLELLTALVANPSGQEYGPRWEDLRDLFRNAHAVLNAYRGWQGREKLIEVMQSLLADGEAKERDWDALEAKVQNLLGDMALRDGLGRISVGVGSRAEGKEEEDKKNKEAEIVEMEEMEENKIGGKKDEERRRMWSLLEQLEQQGV